MAGTKTEKEEARDIHQSNTFYNGVRALLSIGIYAGIGAIVGHYIGRWGEEVDRAGRGMSTVLGRWIGGVGMGGLAAYVSLRGAAEDEQKRDQLKEQNTVLETRLKDLEARLPAEQIQHAEHSGTVAQEALEKAV